LTNLELLENRLGDNIEVASPLPYNENMGGCGPVLIVDDDAGLRRRLRNVLRSGGFATSEAGTAEEALKQAEEQRPSVVIIDVDLGEGKSAHEIYQELRDRIFELPGVFLSGTRKQAIDRAAAALLGVDAYLVKPFGPDELLACVRRLVEREEQRDEARAAELAYFATLTPRQLEVLRLLAVGLSQKEIATTLVISSKTVATHIQYVLEKLDVNSRAQAVAMAHSLGLVDERKPSSGAITKSAPFKTC
jgi:DNA-binding NarL/FixJ family response regulator